MSGGRPEDVERQEDLLRLVQRQRELNFHPGAEFLYCNTGYLLLAEVIGRVTGEKFGDWMRENVFEPLGMTSTQVDDDLRLVNGRAYSYDFCDTSMSIKKIVFNSSAVGYTGLFTTAEDLAKWIRNFRTPEVGGPKVLKRMQKPIVGKKDSSRYALGLYIDDHQGLRRIWHSGYEGGYHTMLAFYPKLDAGVVVLSNFATWDATRTANAVAEAFFGDHMAREKTKNDRPRDAGLTIAAEVLQSYAGNYVIEGGATVMFTRESDGLSIQMGGQPCFPLVALADTLFRANLPGVKMRVSFHVEPDGRVARGTIWQARNTPMRRVEPWSPSPEERALYAGRYYSHELETFYTVAVEDDRLVACHPRHGNIALTPKNKDVFGGSEGFFSDVTFERDQAGVLTGMRVSGAAGRVRNVLFEKQKQ